VGFKALKLMQDFFKEKKVLITGHTGFKGSWLSLWLNLSGAEVIGFSLSPPTDPNIFNALKLGERITHIEGDVRDLEKLKEVVKSYQPEVVFHLSAQSLVIDSYEDPVRTFSTNVMGTVNLLEALRLIKSVKAVVIITSDKCYENKEWFYSYRENDRLGGIDPYSCSKACAELIVKSYRESFFKEKRVGIATVRAGNVIGGGDWQKNRIIPDCVRAITEKKALKLRNPEAVRPWQHVLEPLYGYMLLAKKLWENPEKFSDAWNFGPLPTEVCSVKTLVKKFFKYWGEDNLKVEFLKSSYKESHLLFLDITKTVHLLNWKPVLCLDEAIKLTVEWYKTFYFNPEKLWEVTKKQIKFYEERVTSFTQSE